ncbi:lantibiotic dehydratase [Phytomonospora endophytica]|uniref:Lantibiotic dehydratase N-terminal domain-containing protein n=1 Tax=Phytomonospora endophytica TaxID=714109 RepID=A0A841G5F9_9ACTN|nr:lantibiotic dehydratase [Phytomonospora endophytica]MBB6039999.1 hypothetical protein [Phytomonospora endophytica]GIG71549.1 hypothetical protein Pen01_78440 [Phytomonospora endophytica]
MIDEATIEDLTLGPQPARVPPHLELGLRVHSDSLAGIDHGDFRIEVVLPRDR